MKYCLGITIYHPSKDEINKIIEKSSKFSIYVFDNTENLKMKETTYLQLVEYSNIIYINYDTEINYGLSVALNKMATLASASNFDFICLLDQDSEFNTEDVLEMVNSIEVNHSLLNGGIYAPLVSYKHKLKKKNISMNTINNYEETSWVITSGSFINLKTFIRSNRFDENLFIDRLDLDYAMEMKRLNKKIYVNSGVILNQILGSPTAKRYEHSPIRNYYIFRNRLYFYKKHYSNKKYYRIIQVFFSVKHFLKVLLLEKNKREKLKMINKGLIDYLNGHYGSYRD